MLTEERLASIFFVNFFFCTARRLVVGTDRGSSKGDRVRVTEAKRPDDGQGDPWQAPIRNGRRGGMIAMAIATPTLVPSEPDRLSERGKRKGPELTDTRLVSLSPGVGSYVSNQVERAGGPKGWLRLSCHVVNLYSLSYLQRVSRRKSADAITIPRR
ncbi:hypothetical protein B0H63DRAFT_86027 [Podospora didyma]|uniref:Uncharacterized protein n=1 Tax=Podospora didyma TaxID=330526 RepID=A0AAE0K1C9_9PEZI|nr:hypothetical protein B0H63DRAFT_86027 [Podospora didyma]